MKPQGIAMGMNSKIRFAGWALCALAGFAASGAAFAQVKVNNVVFQEVAVRAADGSTSTELKPVTRVAPGGVVVYEITYRNGGQQTVNDFAINNPLPSELEYLGASVEPSVVSVDGGKTFAPLSDLTVAGENGNPRPARAGDVTNLRWTLASVNPGASGKVTFRARVR
jgi:uncharacterized repeat protein (TIGR01451 family)